MKQVALITGGSSGIGKELAIAHARTGGDLILVARSTEDLEQVQQELQSTFGTLVHIITQDLSQPGAGTTLYQTIKAKNIEVTYLINNAGFGGVGTFHERNWEQDQAMIALNVVTLTELTRAFLPDFVARNSGRILNVSSTASLMPGPMQAVYFATKAYVTSFSQAIAEELSDTNVTVTALLPGATATNFGSVSGMDKTALFADPHSPKEVAEAGYRAMLNGKLTIIAGLSFTQKIVMKLIPFLPTRLLLLQIKKMQSTK